MNSDVIGDPVIGDPNISEPLVVKVKPVVLHAMALTTLLEHGMKQSKVIQEMLNQATFALERARAASNDGPGSVLKMIIPIMIGRKQYFAREMQLWALVMEAAEAELEDIRPAIEAIDAANAAKEEANGGLHGEAGSGEGGGEAGSGEGSGEGQDVSTGDDDGFECNCGFAGTPDDCECDCGRFGQASDEPQPA